MPKSNAEVFIEKYKELEEAVRNTYHLNRRDSISFFLERQEKYKSDKNEIRYCQEIRNLLQHKRKIGNAYPVEPTDKTIAYISSLIGKVRNRKKCCDICVRFSDIYRQTIDGNVKATVNVMREKAYTCVPIMDGKRVVGVFDENSLFNYIGENGTNKLDGEFTFKDIERYLSLENRELEEFLFFDDSKLVDDLEYEFEKSFRRGKRIALVFLTPTGKADEEIVGMLTAWDVLGNT